MKGILLDDGGEIIIEGGTMKIGDVDAQIAEHVITAFQGEYKEIPLLGGNAKKMLNGKPDPFWPSEIKRQLKTQHIEADIKTSSDGNFMVQLKQ
jgi:hypothetical protein